MRFDKLAKDRHNAKTLSGYGVAIGCSLFLLALIPGLSGLAMLSALTYWLVCIRAWPRINGRNKRQIILLIGVCLPLRLGGGDLNQSTVWH